MFNLDLGSKEVIALSMDFMRGWFIQEMHVGYEFNAYHVVERFMTFRMTYYGDVWIIQLGRKLSRKMRLYF